MSTLFRQSTNRSSATSRAVLCRKRAERESGGKGEERARGARRQSGREGERGRGSLRGREIGRDGRREGGVKVEGGREGYPIYIRLYMSGSELIRSELRRSELIRSKFIRSELINPLILILQNLNLFLELIKAELTKTELNNLFFRANKD